MTSGENQEKLFFEKATTAMPIILAIVLAVNGFVLGLLMMGFIAQHIKSHYLPVGVLGAGLLLVPVSLVLRWNKLPQYLGIYCAIVALVIFGFYGPGGDSFLNVQVSPTDTVIGLVVFGLLGLGPSALSLWFSNFRERIAYLEGKK